MTKPITITNEFHNNTVRIRPRPDGTISAATYRRARRTLCPHATCQCLGSMAAGRATAWLLQAEPVYERFAVIAYRLCMEPEDR